MPLYDLNSLSHLLLNNQPGLPAEKLDSSDVYPVLGHLDSPLVYVPFSLVGFS